MKLAQPVSFRPRSRQAMNAPGEAPSRSDGVSVLPFCPFVRSYIAGHTEYLDVVPEDMRAKFDLPAHA